MLDRKAKAVVFGALVIASAIGGTLALESGCTVLTNDALPDDAGIFEGGDAKATSCAACLAAACAAPQALCLTSASCAGILACADADAGAADAGDAGDAAASTTSTCDSTCRTACACSATAATGPSPDRLYHAYTSCNDAKLTACASDCAAENRASSTLPACASDDGGTELPDAAVADGGVDDAGDGGSDAGDAGPPGTGACLACATTSCAAQVAACGSGTECGAFLACSSSCTDSRCLEDCAAQHATGKVAATDLATCTASNCQMSCEL